MLSVCIIISYNDYNSQLKSVKVAQSCPTLCDPKDYTVHEILQVRILEWVAFPFSRGLNFPNSGMEPRAPTLQADSLPVEPQRNPKNTGVGSLSLFQGIFLTQELNWGLIHCRLILYQLSYQGSPTELLTQAAQSCLTLCDPMDHTVRGILQARILERVVFPFSRESSQPRSGTMVSCTAGGFFTNWAIREAQLSY